MAKVAVVLHIPDMTADDLKRIVHDVDALDGPDPISVEHVTGWDVLALIASGQYNPEYKLTFTTIDECKSSGPCGAL